MTSLRDRLRRFIEHYLTQAFVGAVLFVTSITNLEQAVEAELGGARVQTEHGVALLGVYHLLQAIAGFIRTLNRVTSKS